MERDVELAEAFAKGRLSGYGSGAMDERERCVEVLRGELRVTVGTNKIADNDTNFLIYSLIKLIEG